MNRFLLQQLKDDMGNEAPTPKMLEPSHHEERESVCVCVSECAMVNVLFIEGFANVSGAERRRFVYA